MAEPSTLRVEFSSKRESRKFFRSLMARMGCKTLLKLSGKAGVGYGCLKMWAKNVRSIPLEQVETWNASSGLSLEGFRHKVSSMRSILQKASRKGGKKLKEKFGKGWSRVIGLRGKRSLEKRLKEDAGLRRRWRLSIVAALTKKYGENPYVALGKLGGPKSIQSVPPDVLAKRLEKAFRNSFRKRIEFSGRRFRSKKEVEVARVLERFGIPYEYEKRILGFYPDFLIKPNIIIEVVGFDWRFHLNRTKEKIGEYRRAGFDVVVYTYPNMRRYFDGLGLSVFLEPKELGDFLNLKAGYYLT